METIQEGGVPINLWTDDVEPQARDQLINVSRLPVVGPHIAVMPDVHLGKGATVGSVIPTRKAIIPAAVGVDIGCGMMAQRLTATADDLPDSLRTIRSRIEQKVPVGFKSHRDVAPKTPETNDLDYRYSQIAGKSPGILNRKAEQRAHWSHQLGTLGGGNHFIELCLDEDNQLWAMLHSGSRGPGNRIGVYWINKAKEQRLALDGHTPDDKDLSWLDEGTDDFNDYVEALNWAQDFAAANRRRMMAFVLNVLEHSLPDCHPVGDPAVNCHHNYTSKEVHFGQDVWLTRKGAINASAGTMGIIPGSMGTRSYIVRGKGSADSFHSCAHGAGRRMSRTAARKQFTTADLAQQTAGVECRKDQNVVDEIPGAYKDIDDVMARQTDLVDVVAVLKQALCVKG